MASFGRRDRNPAKCEIDAIQQDRKVFAMFHKRILEWQAAHPNITWIVWGIVWAIVLVLLLWPKTSE